MHRKWLCYIIIAIMFLSGCGAKKESSSASNRASGVATEQQKAMDTATASKGSYPAESPEAATAGIQEQKIIVNYNLDITVDDVRAASKQINNKAKELGGYIEGEELGEFNSSSVARVPSDKVEAFVEFIEKTFDVRNKRKATENITEAYVDNEARLTNLKAEEAQMQEVLKKAVTVEDILRVQSELFRIRGEIESLEARKKSWDKQVDFSTVTINVSRKYIAPDNKIRIISGSDFGNAISKGFMNTLLGLILAVQKLIIFLVSNIIILLILGIAAYFIYKKYKKSISKQ